MTTNEKFTNFLEPCGIDTNEKRNVKNSLSKTVQ